MTMLIYLSVDHTGDEWRVSQCDRPWVPTMVAVVIKWKQKNTTIMWTIPKSNIKIVERDKTDIPNIQIYDHSLSWLGTGTSIKTAGLN